MEHAYPEWQRLQDILARIKAEGFEALQADEIIEFGKLYRRAMAELAFQRMHEADPKRLAFLNELTAQSYPYVYVAPRRPWPSVGRFFAADFPRAFRQHFPWILLATLLSLIPALISYLLTTHDRAIAAQVLPAELMYAADSVSERHHSPKDWLPLLERTPAAGMIITNNIKVSVLAFAGGMTGGLLTIFLMIYNGVMLGVVGAAVAVDGPSTALSFWAFVAPHGVLELTAIFISGGAGLLLAYALLNPGELPRRVALRRAGLEALKLMLGVAAMLVVAGCIESFFSPTLIDEEIKLTVASGEFILLFSYLGLAGRGRVEEPETPFGTLLSPVPPI